MSKTVPNSIHVLHVDDDENLLQYTRLFLEKYNPQIKITSFSTPNELLEMNLAEYDCIISDYAMPHLNGINLTEKIREKSDIPIILYTGQGSEEVAESAFSVGVDDYLRKEFDPSHYQVLANRVKSVVEKHHAIRALKQNQELLSRYLDSATYSVYIFDSDLKLVQINKRARENLGTSEVHIGKHTLELSPGLENLPRYKEYIKVLETGTPYSVETVLSHSERGEIQMYISAFRVGGGMGLILQDISERKRIEEELLSSEKRYHDYIDNAPDGMLIVNAEGIYTMVNEAVSIITGYSREEILGKKVGIVFGPKESDEPLLFFQKVKRVGKGFADIPFINKNGVERWWNVNAVKLSDSQYMVFVKDITERKYVEDKLKINKKLLRTLMDSAPDSYHLYDSQLRLIEYARAQVSTRI